MSLSVPERVDTVGESQSERVVYNAVASGSYASERVASRAKASIHTSQGESRAASQLAAFAVEGHGRWVNKGTPVLATLTRTSVLSVRENSGRDRFATTAVTAAFAEAPASMPVTVFVKPYWAIASLCLAVAALTALICLEATASLDLTIAVFLGLFSFGLGTSSLGLLLTAPGRPKKN